MKGKQEMKVKIKSFVVDMDVKKKGIEFEVRSPDGNDHRGDCYLTNTGVTWCLKRKAQERGIKLTWEDFIDLMSSRDTLKRALKAARQATEN